MSDQEQMMQNMGGFQELQETEQAGGFDFGTVNRIKLLSINGVPSATNGGGGSLPDVPVPSADQCNMCGSMKRPSPSSLSEQPISKKLNLQPSAAADDFILHGYTKLHLPKPFPHPTLRRTLSDPTTLPGTSNHPSNPLSPENATVVVPVTAPSQSKAPAVSASLPPLPPSLRRSVSDASNAAAYLTTGTSPPPSAARTVPWSRSHSDASPDSIKDESPDSKRLKRMRERMKMMSQWCNEVLNEEESGPGNNNETLKDDFEMDPEEAVKVERKDDCVVIRFKCPCKIGYNILLCGDACYYKLI